MQLAFWNIIYDSDRYVDQGNTPGVDFRARSTSAEGVETIALANLMMEAAQNYNLMLPGVYKNLSVNTTVRLKALQTQLVGVFGVDRDQGIVSKGLLQRHFFKQRDGENL